MNFKQLYIFLLLSFVNYVLHAQSQQNSLPLVQKGNVNKEASKLSRSLDSRENDGVIAANYESLAKEFFQNGAYDKAEDYFKKAKQIYSKRDPDSKLSNINRELAKVYEARKSFKEAITYYEEAAKTTKDKKLKQLNENDANRLRNMSNPEVKSGYIQSNISLLEQEGKKEDKAIAYRQMAETNLQMSQNEMALDNYEKALSNVADKPEEAVQIKKEMADVYIAEKEYDKAIDLNKNLLSEASEKKDVSMQISQLQSLSSVYFVDNKAEQGVEALMQAYNLALEKRNTLETIKCLGLLTGYYKKNQADKRSVALYESFLDSLENLIQSDTSLVDASLFLATEEKIVRLEKERELTDELLKKKNTFNYVLIGSIVLMLFLLGLIIKALYSIKVRNKKIALQSLRREMNPHFIFNSLNSVNQFIAQNNELEANKYLSSYSKLMRNVMENSNKDFIKLSSEVEQLEEYLDLEHLRFGDKFDYEIIVDEAIDPETVYIPNMLVQPHLENAIWHGLRYGESKGLLKLVIVPSGKEIKLIVDDTGIGLEESRRIKTRNQKIHESRGLINIQERIKLLNEIYHIGIVLKISDKTSPLTGVVVEMLFPRLVFT